MEAIAWNLMLADGVNALLPQLALAYGMTCLLPMRKKPLFYLIFVGVPVVINTVLFYIWNIGLVPGLVVLVFASFILPVVLYEGSLVVRVVAVLASQICGVLAEALFFASLELLIGSTVPTGESYAGAFLVNVSGWLLLEFARMILILALLWLLKMVLERQRMQGEARPRMAAMLILLLAEVLVMAVAVAVCSQDVPGFWYVIVAVVAACFLVIDVLALETAGRCLRKLDEQARCAELMAKVRAYAAEDAGDLKDIEKVARIRHDIRNEIAVVSALLDDGDNQAALVMLDDLIAKCEALEETCR